MDILIVVFVLIAAILLYFLPSLIANRRGHRNTGAIVVLNLFLGWTFLGWVLTLVWALTDNTDRTFAQKYRGAS
jgi:T4 superinfection immunity protein